MRLLHYRYVYVLMAALLFASCIRDAVSEVSESSPVRRQLGLDGVIVVRASALGDEEIPQEVLTVREMRVLLFNSGGNIVSNTLLGPEHIMCDVIPENNITILSVSESAPKITTSLGEHSVYVVLNESAAGITTALQDVSTVDEMEQIRRGRVAYTDLIAVTPGEEPPFVMCVHDRVNIGSANTSLNLTGLTERGNPTYGFPMRRSMAKVILESVTGGVTPDGYVLGTGGVKWDGNVAVDQFPEDHHNNDLIATSQIHILGVELVNVPAYISWAQDGSELTDLPEYTDVFRADPIPIATSDYHLTNRYFDRIWPGHMHASGKVKFTRTDAMYSMWKVQKNSGSNAYAVYDPADVEANPDLYYNWGITGGSIPVPNDVDLEITYSDAMKTATNFSHYVIDSLGFVHIYDTSGREYDAPNNSMYTLNKGNFTAFFQQNYGNMSGNFVPGRPVAGEMDVRPEIDPAVWQLNFNPVAYYIPENITSDPERFTRIRVTASLAVPTAELNEDEVNQAINSQGNSGTLVGEEGKLDMSDDNIINYLYAKGTMLPHPTKEGYYALVYAGLARMFEGTVTVEGADGRYENIVGTQARVVTIDVPLNNDEVDGMVADVNTDHNVYRGHEYRVRLYITRKAAAWPDPTVNDAPRRSVTYYPLPRMQTRSASSGDLYLAVEVSK